MSNCTRNNKRHGAPSEVHKAARLDVRLVNRSTPGFRSTGAYTMLFDCCLLYTSTSATAT